MCRLTAEYKITQIDKTRETREMRDRDKRQEKREDRREDAQYSEGPSWMGGHLKYEHQAGVG